MAGIIIWLTVSWFGQDTSHFPTHFAPPSGARTWSSKFSTITKRMDLAAERRECGRKNSKV